MYEEEFLVSLWAAILLGLWVAKLKWTNRKLRKQIAAGSAVPAEPIPAEAAPRIAERDPEVERLRARVAVLERITVEKEHSLAREIDGLRDR